MKRTIFCVSMVVALLMASCVSLQDRTMTPQERERADIVGSVTVKFTSTHLLHIQRGVKEKAYAELKKAAQQRYPGNIDIQNIVMSGTFSGWNILWASVMFLFPVLLDVQEITATGDVVRYNTASGRDRTFQQTVEGALDRAAEQALKNVPQRSRIAIVYITAQDRGTTEYIVGELEYIWVNQGYFLTDRSQLDRLRREQNFQMSGEVDDATAVSIGKFAGADIIVTGRVDGEGNLRRLRLRALNTQTAQVIGVASERL